MHPIPPASAWYSPGGGPLAPAPTCALFPCGAPGREVRPPRGTALFWAPGRGGGARRQTYRSLFVLATGKHVAGVGDPRGQRSARVRVFEGVWLRVYKAEFRWETAFPPGRSTDFPLLAVLGRALLQCARRDGLRARLRTAPGSPGKRGEPRIKAPGRSPGRSQRPVCCSPGAWSCASLFPAPITHAARVPRRPRWQQRRVWETREGRGRACRGGAGIPRLLSGWGTRISSSSPLPLYAPPLQCSRV